MKHSASWFIVLVLAVLTGGCDEGTEKTGPAEGPIPAARKPLPTEPPPEPEQAISHPVMNVSSYDAVAFCAWLSKKEGRTYRLPTEAEWEYACRAGTTTRFYHGDDVEGLAKVGNVADAAAYKKRSCSWGIASNDGYAFTSPVGSFLPNDFGLYDMHGNAEEWCAEWYAADYFESSPTDDPTGPTSGSYRVYRGGGWRSFARRCCRSAYRYRDKPDDQAMYLGFRVALAPVEASHE